MISELSASMAELEDAEKEYRALKGRLERNKEQLGPEIPDRYRKAFDRLEGDVGKAGERLRSLRERVMEEATDVLLDVATARLGFKEQGEKEKAVIEEIRLILAGEMERGLGKRVNDILFKRKDIEALLDEAGRIRSLILESGAFRDYWDFHCIFAKGRIFNDLINAEWLEEDGLWHREGYAFCGPAPPERPARPAQKRTVA